MKQLLPLLIGLLVLGGGAGYVISDLSKREDQARYDAGLAKVQRDSAMLVPQVVGVPDGAVPGEATRLFQHHQDGVNALYKTFPDLKNPDAFLQGVERKAKAGTYDDEKRQAFTERYEALKALHKDIIKGEYRPVWTQRAGAMRLDVVRLRPKQVKGRSWLVADIVMWGPVKERITFGAMDLKLLVEHEVPGRRGRMVDKKAVIPITASNGTPSTLIDAPYEWMPGFPPGVMVGTYNLPVLPRATTRLSLKLNMITSAAGGSRVPAQFEFLDVEVPPTWTAPSLQDDDLREAEEADAEALESAGFMSALEKKRR